MLKRNTYPWSKSSGFCGFPKKKWSIQFLKIPSSSNCTVVSALCPRIRRRPKHHHGDICSKETFEIWKYHNQKSGINSPVEGKPGRVPYPHDLQGFSTMSGGWPWDFWSINSMFISTFQGMPIKPQQMVFRNHLAPKLEGPGIYPETA